MIINYDNLKTCHGAIVENIVFNLYANVIHIVSAKKLLAIFTCQCAPCYWLSVNSYCDGGLKTIECTTMLLHSRYPTGWLDNTFVMLYNLSLLTNGLYDFGTLNSQ